MSWFSVSKETQRVAQIRTCLWSYHSWLEKTTSNHCYFQYHRPSGPWDDMKVVSIGWWLQRRGPKSTKDTKQICVWCSPYFTPSHVPTTYSSERASHTPGLQGLGGCSSSCCGVLPAVLHSLLAISTRTLHVTHTQISQFSSDDISRHLSARTNCQEPEFVILSCHLKSCSLVVTEPEPLVQNATMFYVQIHSL